MRGERHSFRKDPLRHSTVDTSFQNSFRLLRELTERPPVLGLPGYPAAELSGSFLRLMHFAFEGEKSLKEKMTRTAWSPIINTGDERRDKREKVVGRAQHTSRRKLRIEPLENDGD